MVPAYCLPLGVIEHKDCKYAACHRAIKVFALSKRNAPYTYVYIERVYTLSRCGMSIARPLAYKVRHKPQSNRWRGSVTFMYSFLRLCITPYMCIYHGFALSTKEITRYTIDRFTAAAVAGNACL